MLSECGVLDISSPFAPKHSAFYYNGNSSALYAEVRFSQLKFTDNAYAGLEWLPKFPGHEHFC